VEWNGMEYNGMEWFHSIPLDSKNEHTLTEWSEYMRSAIYLGTLANRK
jgi:hypothetical protein